MYASVSSSTPAPQLRLNVWVMVLTSDGPYFWDRWWLRPDGPYVRLEDLKVFETIDAM